MMLNRDLDLQITRVDSQKTCLSLGSTVLSPAFIESIKPHTITMYYRSMVSYLKPVNKYVSECLGH